jgi:hypothetical protein
MLEISFDQEPGWYLALFFPIHVMYIKHDLYAYLVNVYSPV